MRVITNISNITDSSGTAPVVTYSNQVQTFIQTPPTPRPRNIFGIIIIDNLCCCGSCNCCNNFGFNNFSSQNNQMITNFQNCNCNAFLARNNASCGCYQCSCNNCCNNNQNNSNCCCHYYC